MADEIYTITSGSFFYKKQNSISCSQNYETPKVRLCKTKILFICKNSDRNVQLK